MTREVVGTIAAAIIVGMAGVTLAMNLPIPMNTPFWLVLFTLSATAVWGLGQ